MTLRCWAADHSACGGGQSHEHLVSRGVLNQSRVFVQGFPWCVGAEQHIGVSSATAKILCRDHNSATGELDDAAAYALRCFEGSAPSSTVRPPISGPLLERWLLKTVINLSDGSTSHIGWGMAGSKAGRPSRYLLNVVFGTTPFSDHMGLYFLIPAGPYRFRQGEIVICPIVKGETIGGAYFGLRGIDLFLSLVPGAIPPALRSMGVVATLPDHVLDAQPIYRAPELTITTNDGTAQPLTIQWNARNG